MPRSTNQISIIFSRRWAASQDMIGQLCSFFLNWPITRVLIHSSPSSQNLYLIVTCCLYQLTGRWPVGQGVPIKFSCRPVGSLPITYCCSQGWNFVKKILRNKFSRFLKSDLSTKVFQIFSSSNQAKPKFKKVKIIPGEQIQIVEQIENHG